MKIIKYFPYKGGAFSWNDIIISSSTLFGAISNMWVLYYGKEFIKNFFDAYKNKEIKFSSLFPFLVQENREILFYPRPILPFFSKEEDNEHQDTKKIKAVKKVRLLSEKVFIDIYNSIEQIDGEYYYTYSLINDKITIYNDFAFYKDEYSPPVHSLFDFAELPHVSIDRFNISHKNEGGLYYTNDLFFSSAIGFYFICECEKEWENKLIPLFYLLADEGLGGNRSTGKGLFEKTHIEEYTFPEIKNKKIYIGMSNILPQEKETDTIYTISLKKDDGFIYYGAGRSLKKSLLYLIKEGAVYTNKVEGSLIEETLGNITIYRNGMAFIIGGSYR